ncbi:hypothetical protein GCM10010168_56380 [Actinoplanes ianthinogenes]|uniref:DNA-binding protein n=1 Tax=Actinoplanes ianthinogenes TaxID=122358 RepID=A0ABM7M2W8_9ACTN|nr:hypothetical protein [Actinoplanes ianthinogenes]BCJ45942.1 hypothetical protein Aiant_65990 [Actinoplanes ianthinogenes]GGR30996.1 hypothetical protein GCM10010168_56380 [Actinoplanes ianthinogenes]
MSDVEVLTARAYRHPVLGDRTVVRLVGASLGQAEDLSMEFLGFAAAGSADVGHGVRQALGFPAWALIHDPANGRHALALVKEMEKLARTARSKPGTAVDGYRALAERLGLAAPQFLPTFWEQAGRTFLSGDNKRMAGSCFTEARRAEQVHGLVIDEDRVREVHLEFAFAGALTATMLTAYTREVVDRRPPAEAYELVKTLSLRRVAGGLPPHSSMAADLARLARAAGLDAEREADEVAARLLGYPAVARSHPSVWKAYRKSLVRLGKRDAAARARLLQIIPDPPGYDTDLTDQWLELLEDSTAVAALTATGPADGTAARWLERLLASRRSGWRHRRSARLLDLVGRMLPRLAAEGGVRIASTPWHADLDVLDACLAAGVPITFGQPDTIQDFSLDDWARDDRPGRRDLTAVAADPRWRAVLARSVRTAIARLRDGRSLTGPALPDETLRQAFGAAGVRDLLVEMLTERTTRAGDGTIASLDYDLTELAALWSPAGMALAPDGFRRLLTVDLPALVTRTLRAGLPVELAWPDYQEAAKQKHRVQFGDAWPELVVHDHHSAHILTPGGGVTEHVFRLPRTGQPFRDCACRLVDGDLLVSAWNWETSGSYWSSRPDEIFEGDLRFTPARWGVATVQLPLPGGGATTGTLPIHPGDRHRPSTLYPLATDGQAFWRCEPADGMAYGDRWQWREFDPRTGDAGRVSVPAFLASGDRPLIAEVCHLRPAPAGFAGSPLGWRDGMVGWRAEVSAAGDQTGEGIDGRRVTVPEQTLIRFGQHTGTTRLSGAVLLPGATDPLPVTRLAGHPRGHLQIWTADGGHLLAQMSDGTSTLPPLAWWHGLRARDAAGSAALRALDEPTAAALLAVDDEITVTADVKAAVEANVAAHLPAVTDSTLRERIVEVVARAVRMRRRIAEIPGHLTDRAAAPAPAPAATDTALEAAWAGLCGFDRDQYHGYDRRPEIRYDILTQVGALGTILAGAQPESLPAVPPNWAPVLAGLGALAVRAASPATGDDDRQALAAFLGTVAGTPLDGGTPLRVLAVTHPGNTPPAPVHRDGGQVTALLPVGQRYYFRVGDQDDRTVVQIAADGAFTPPAGCTVEQELRPSGRLAGERLTAFLTLLAERGPAPWRPAAAEALAEAAGMTRAEAVLLLAGLPSIASWEANFLTAGQRATLGLSAAHAKVAHAALRTLTGPQRVALIDAAMPTDPAALWTDGPDVASIAREWIRIRGRRVPVPEDLVAELARVVDRDLAASIVQAIAEPTPGDWLSSDGRLLAGQGARMGADHGVPFDGRHLNAAAVALPWLAYRLAWDDPLRATLPGALRLVRERLRHPDLLVGHGWFQTGQRPDAGPALVEENNHATWTTVYVAPAKLSGADDPALGFIDEPTADALRIVLSGWIDEALTTPAGATGDPHDPRVSVPELVDQVRERFGLDTDAAAYYLQLLALPDPTDKAVPKWNGWKTAALRQAQTALTEAGLVVAAKRERAARPVFLPGGWQAAKAPRLPVETWKLPLYRDRGQVLFVPRSLPALFAAAWSRITAGDLPRYHDLTEHTR